jgi:hypothetical protein
VAFPFTGAVQVKHHRSAAITTGPDAVRDLTGAIAAKPFNLGVVITNTTFTPDARWFAENQGNLIH